MNSPFKRFARREKISNQTLVSTIENASKGLIDADLGGNIIKQRIARAGQGKSGGYRTIIAFKKGDKAFFIHGFAKNEKDNIDKKEEQALKKYAKILFSMNDKQLKEAVDKQELTEIK